MKILIMGLPGSGKTYLAERLAKELGAVHFNADRVRGTVNNDLSFSLADRIEHSRRMGEMCSIVNDAGYIAIADFVCPTPATRTAFNAGLTIWMDTVQTSRYEDTNALFVPPENVNYTLHTLQYDIEDVLRFIRYHREHSSR